MWLSPGVARWCPHHRESAAIGGCYFVSMEYRTLLRIESSAYIPREASLTGVALNTKDPTSHGPKYEVIVGKYLHGDIDAE